MLSTIGIMLWLAALQVGAPQRGTTEAAPARGRIIGVVVRAGVAAVGAQRELSGVRVEIRPGNRVEFTRGGEFSFAGLAPGRYSISVTRDGYFPQVDRQRGITAAGITVTVSSSEAVEIEIPMVAAPVLTGRVFDPFGDPVPAGLVRAYRREYTPYGPKLRSIKKGMTNDFGEFRLWGLPFGAYAVSAGYGDRDRATAIGNVRLSANVSKADAGYATLFYDGTADISRAQAARLTPDLFPSPLNIHLKDTARFAIRGVVLPVIAGTRIALAPQGSDLTDADFSAAPNGDGSFEIRGVSPGSYVLLARSSDGAFASDVLTFNVTDNDINGVRFAMQQTMTVAGRIILEGRPRANLSEARVKLSRTAVEFDQRFEAPAGVDGDFVLEHLSPATPYDITVDPLPSGAYIKSIASGGRNVLGGASPLVPDAPLMIELAESPENLDVRVTNGANPSAGVQVVLVPEPALRRRADRYITGFTDVDGTLQFTGVPPGQYTAYAFEDIEPGAYYALAYNPGVDNRFRDRALPVTVGGPQGAKAIRLRVVTAPETAGGLQ